jgi:hypothetical protein
MSIFGRSKLERKATTKTPSVNKSAYSYYRSQNNDDPKQAGRLTKKSSNKTKTKSRLVDFIKRLPAIFLVLALIISFIYVSLINPNSELIVSSNNIAVRDEQEYRSRADEYIKASLINRSKLFFDSTGLESDLKNNFPEIAFVDVEIPLLGKRPVIKLQTTQPVLLLHTVNKNRYIIGNNGITLTDNIDEGIVSDLLVVKDNSSVPIENGKLALSQDQVIFISKVAEQLKNKNLDIKEIILPENPFDMHFYIKGRNYFVKFNSLEDPVSQAGSFLAINESLEKQNNLPKKYVDVRAGERVFYR